ncbi:hypothetical protein DMN91_012354 [Ooceraea biroi]|uniref:Uncharacterized protein n=1 Tax=Ooceraea biroi TaxID=2015173 RepID=A0A3L8D4P6_OOCBI|nr:hypothetical protein DMN91_012354 [Ooceraea biroi]
MEFYQSAAKEQKQLTHGHRIHLSNDVCGSANVRVITVRVHRVSIDHQLRYARTQSRTQTKAQVRIHPRGPLAHASYLRPNYLRICISLALRFAPNRRYFCSCLPDVRSCLRRPYREVDHSIEDSLKISSLDSIQKAMIFFHLIITYALSACRKSSHNLITAGNFFY